MAPAQSCKHKQPRSAPGTQAPLTEATCCPGPSTLLGSPGLPEKDEGGPRGPAFRLAFFRPPFTSLLCCASELASAALFSRSGTQQASLPLCLQHTQCVGCRVKQRAHRAKAGRVWALALRLLRPMHSRRLPTVCARLLAFALV